MLRLLKRGRDKLSQPLFGFRSAGVLAGSFDFSRPIGKTRARQDAPDLSCRAAAP